MKPQDILRLLVLSSVWGGSFIFMRVASPALGAVVTAEARVCVAAAGLLLYALLTRQRLELGQRWSQYLVVGIVNSAIPFALICWAEIRLTASFAAILNATSPLFGALFAAAWLKDGLTASKVAGMVLAFLGVALLAGWTPSAGNGLLPVGACLLAAACYGLGATYAKAKCKGAPAMGMAAGSQVGAALFLAPALPLGLPVHPPGLAPILCLVALALVSTAFAYVLYFRLIADVGPAKALTVTFLSPAFGVLWGAIFLGEALTPLKLASAAIIFAGTALVTGAVAR